MAPTFVEIGASGRSWDLDSTLALLAAEDPEAGTPAIGMTHVDARALKDDVVQVFWESDRGGRRARRTSLWQKGTHGWQQVYHQGTPLPDQGDAS